MKEQKLRIDFQIKAINNQHIYGHNALISVELMALSMDSET